MLTLVAGENRGPVDSLLPIIHHERKWFEGADGDADSSLAPRISTSRWIGYADGKCEQESEIEPDCHVIGVNLRPLADVTLFAARKLIHSGPLPRGSMRVSQPGLPRRGIFAGAYDVLHLHVPNDVIAEYASAEQDHERIGERPVVDSVIERLARSLIDAEELGGAFGQSYAESIGFAITARVFGRRPDGAPAHRARVSDLPKWRLKRATEYMAAANLSEPIRLADIATAAGLSRMHFAAQFRAATGLRPHEYLIQRRIERAQHLLLHSRLPLVEIAMEVGFKTQAHFTTVFARLVNETPNVWRRNCGTMEIPVLRAA